MSNHPPHASHFQKCSASVSGGPPVTLPMIFPRGISVIVSPCFIVSKLRPVAIHVRVSDQVVMPVTAPIIGGAFF